MQNNNEGLSKIVFKNSIYSFASLFLLKFGGLILTILIARVLLPELFGIYSLALSIVSIATSFTDLGISNTFLRYLSETLGKNNKKARSFFKYLLKIKFSLILAVVFIILILSKFISYNIYDKPALFYPLIFSCLFIISESLKTFIGSIFQATKNLKSLPLFDFLHQLLKISLSLLAIFFIQSEFKISALFIAFAIAGFFHLFLLFIISFKRNKSIYIGDTGEIDKKRTWNYLTFMGLTSVALVLFSSIDTLILGKFVDANFIAYYRVALTLILTLASVFTLSGVFLPVFTQINNSRFQRGFQKTFRYLMMIAIPSVVGIIFIGKYLLLTIYGNEYLLATTSLYILSVLVLIDPLIGFYNAIFQAKEKTKLLAKSITWSLIMNIILNYTIIKILQSSGSLDVLIGVSIVTVFSRLLLLILFMLIAKKQFNLRVRGIGWKKPLFSVLIMGLFLFIYNTLIDINLFYGIIEVLSAAIIYFLVLFLIKGITNEDIVLIKGAIRDRGR